jgi:protein-L-isoaspartate(D-aspartate) O-methyltransferase
MSNMNYTIARDNMVSQQLRTWDVFDPRVLHLLGLLPRENFVPERFKHLAYSDTALPLDNGHYLAPPREQARMLQALAPQPADKVLEIGARNGYLTECLARLCEREVSQDCSKNEHFDVICIHGSVKKLNENLKSQLAVGGRLYAVIGDKPAMSATLITRISETQWQTQVLFETVAPRLGHDEPQPEFEF